MSAPGRALTTFAAGFFLLDAVLLVWAGVEQHRSRLVVGGLVCAAAAVSVVLLWRRYRRVLEDVDASRREMKAEAESIRQLLKQRHLEN